MNTTGRNCSAATGGGYNYNSCQSCCFCLQRTQNKMESFQPKHIRLVAIRAEVGFGVAVRNSCSTMLALLFLATAAAASVTPGVVDKKIITLYGKPASTNCILSCSALHVYNVTPLYASRSRLPVLFIRVTCINLFFPHKFQNRHC